MENCTYVGPRKVKGSCTYARHERIWGTEEHDLGIR